MGRSVWSKAQSRRYVDPGTWDVALDGFDPAPIAARVARAAIASCEGQHVLAITERVAGHQPIEFDNDEAELAVGAIVAMLSPGYVKGTPHIDNIVVGLRDTTRDDLMRALRWQAVAREMESSLLAHFHAETSP